MIFNCFPLKKIESPAEFTGYSCRESLHLLWIHCCFQPLLLLQAGCPVRSSIRELKLFSAKILPIKSYRSFPGKKFGTKRVAGSCLICVSASERQHPECHLQIPGLPWWSREVRFRAMDRVVHWCWDPLLLLKNSQAGYSGNEKGIFLMFLFKVNQGRGLGCSRITPGSQITVDTQ